MIRTLIEHGANVRDMNRWGRTALHTASLLPNNSAVLELLLNKGLDVNIKASAGETALAEAAWIGNKGNVAFLLSKVGKWIVTVFWDESLFPVLRFIMIDCCLHGISLLACVLLHNVVKRLRLGGRLTGGCG